MPQQHLYGFASLLSQADAVGVAVLAILLLMSIASWYFILLKVMLNARMKRRARDFLEHFWSAPSLESVATRLSQRPPEDPFARVAVRGLEAMGHFRRSAPIGLVEGGGQAEFVTRAIRRAITRETAALESGLTVLASVGSTAPFVGLFGTVWGIYHALIAIGTSGTASLDAVAGPVGEALIMTAAGLAVAIPAVLAYNFFVRGNRVVLAELDGFAHDLHAFLTAWSKLDSGARSAQPAGRAEPAEARAA